MDESAAHSPGALLREARTRANLSQTDVARRAHLTQSVVSSYESGHREPAFGTLERLIAATGHRLEISLTPAPGARPGLPNTPLGRRLRQRRRQVLAAAGKHGASNVRVFGSVARGEDTPESDIDILVDLANRQPGCFGARLTGGGFGGCTVNLVAATHAAAFVEAMRAGYLAATGIAAEIYTSRASAGAHAIPL